MKYHTKKWVRNTKCDHHCIHSLKIIVNIMFILFYNYRCCINKFVSKKELIIKNIIRSTEEIQNKVWIEHSFVPQKFSIAIFYRIITVVVIIFYISEYWILDSVLRVRYGGSCLTRHSTWGEITGNQPGIIIKSELHFF